MPIAIAAKISALLNGLTTDQLNELSPVERRKFAEICFHWFQLADRPRKGEPRRKFRIDGLTTDSNLQGSEPETC